MLVSDGGGSVTPVKPTPPPAPKPATTAHTAATTTSASTAVAAKPDVIGAKTTDPPGVGENSTPSYDPDLIQLQKTNPQLAHVIRQEDLMDQNDGTFNSGTTASPNEQRIANALANPVKNDVAQGRPISQNDAYYLNQYVAGNEKDIGGADKNTTEAQRLQNAMSGLGPQATAAWLQSPNGPDINNKNFQGAFNSLVSSGQLTPADARALADGEAANNTSQNPDFRGSATASLVQGLGNDQNSVDFKNAYAHQAINAAEGITSNLYAGKYSGDQKSYAQTERTALYSQARSVLDSTTNNDDVKRAAFEQMKSDADSLSQSKDKADQQAAQRIYGDSADVLGGASPGAIDAELKSIAGPGGIDQYGNINTDPSKGSTGLANYLRNAVSGQASFGTDVTGDMMGATPNGVSKLLSGMAQSGDPKLTQGVLSTITDQFNAHPDQAQAITAQDALFGNHLQSSISSALGSSFDQFVNRNGTPGIDPRQASELTTMSAIENGPPFEKGQAQQFEGMLQQNLQKYSDYALGKSSPSETAAMNKMFAGQEGSKQAAAADVVGGVSQSYFRGFYAEQANLDAQAAGTKAPDTFGSILGTAGDITTLAGAIPGVDVPGLATAGTIEGVAGTLHSLGLFQPNDAAAAQKAAQKLSGLETQSGTTAGAQSMSQYFQNFYDGLLKNQTTLSGFTNGAGASIFGPENGFLTGYNPPIHQDY